MSKHEDMSKKEILASISRPPATEYRGYLIATTCVIRTDNNRSYGRAMIGPLRNGLPQYPKLIRADEENGHEKEADAHASATETAMAVVDGILCGLAKG